MRVTSVLLVGAVALLALASCVITVPDANKHAEAEDLTNDVTPEVPAFTATTGEWYEITGTFDTATDLDEYEISLPSGQTALYEVKVFHNDEVVADGFLGVNDFPLNAYPYDGTTVLVSMLLAASDTDLDWSDYGTADRVILSVYATDSALLGAPLPFDSGTYTIQFRI